MVAATPVVTLGRLSEDPGQLSLVFAAQGVITVNILRWDLLICIDIRLETLIMELALVK